LRSLLGLPLVGRVLATDRRSRVYRRTSGRAGVGKVAPDFELELLNGHKLRLSDHVGRELIVLNFFAT
jgi:hypothetical protein